MAIQLAVFKSQNSCSFAHLHKQTIHICFQNIVVSIEFFPLGLIDTKRVPITQWKLLIKSRVKPSSQ